MDPAVAATDKALQAGSADELATLVTKAVAAGIQMRFANVVERRRQAEETVGADREYVEAYVEFVHYAERLYEDALGEAAAHGESSQPETEQHRH